jgi:hypothetical protein
MFDVKIQSAPLKQEHYKVAKKTAQKSKKNKKKDMFLDEMKPN